MIDFGYINSNRKVKLNYLLEKPKPFEIDYKKRDVKNESIQMIESWPTTKNNGNCLFLVIEF